MQSAIDAFSAAVLRLELVQQRMAGALRELVQSVLEPHDAKWLVEWRGRMRDLVAELDAVTDELMRALEGIAEHGAEQVMIDETGPGRSTGASQAAS